MESTRHGGVRKLPPRWRQVQTDAEHTKCTLSLSSTGDCPLGKTHETYSLRTDRFVDSLLELLSDLPSYREATRWFESPVLPEGVLGRSERVVERGYNPLHQD